MSESGKAITVEVQLFARLREVCGDRPSVSVDVPRGATAGDCFAGLCRRFEALAPFRDTLAVAVNEEYASWEHQLEAGDVVALIPPVSGGGPVEAEGRAGAGRWGPLCRDGGGEELS